MNIKLTDITKITGYKTKKNTVSLGLDTAKRSGLAIIQTNDKYATLNWLFIEFKDAGSKTQIYKTMVKTFENYFINIDKAVIEQVFVGFNRAGSVELARYGSFAIAECIKKEIPYDLISAVSARSRLGIKTSKSAGYGKGKSKLAVADYLKNNFDIELDDEDASDAIILAMLGILEGVKF